MGTKLTTEEIAEILPVATKAWELILNGSRSRADIQAFIEGRIVTEVQHRMGKRAVKSAALFNSGPSWYVSAEDQLEDVRRLNIDRGWGFTEADFPKLLSDSRTSLTRVLLLAVYLPDKDGVPGILRTYNEHIAVIKNRLDAKCVDFSQRAGARFAPDDLRLYNAEHRPGLRWVIYEPGAYYSDMGERSVKNLWDQGVEGLAASEVLGAMMLFPGYRKYVSMLGSPNLAGYDGRDHKGAWGTVPYVVPMSGDKSLLLLANRNDRKVQYFVAPAVTEL